VKHLQSTHRRTSVSSQARSYPLQVPFMWPPYLGSKPLPPKPRRAHWLYATSLRCLVRTKFLFPGYPIILEPVGLGLFSLELNRIGGGEGCRRRLPRPDLKATLRVNRVLPTPPRPFLGRQTRSCAPTVHGNIALIQRASQWQGGYSDRINCARPLPPFSSIEGWQKEGRTWLVGSWSP
jgi:hypothetical protein